MSKSLTDKQRTFVREYVKDFNLTQAAIRSGYSEKTAHTIGSENIRKPLIREAIQEYIDETIEDDRMTLKREIIDKLRSIAFSEPDKREDKDGEVISVSYRDNIRALELLGKYMAMWTEDKNIKVTVDQTAYDELKALYGDTTTSKDS